MRQIAIYGKGGIGKSTTVQNIAAALAEKGKNILLIGCDPKADSTRLISGKSTCPTILDTISGKDSDVLCEDIVKTGFLNIRYVESGGPEPGCGCAGRGISSALSVLSRLKVFGNDIDFVLYDVLGDVVCGGFTAPIRRGFADEVYIVTSGEFMSLYAANNICWGIRNNAETGNVRLGGFICNQRLGSEDQRIVESFAHQVGSNFVCFIPRSSIMRKAEFSKKTIIEYAGSSEQAEVYRSIAEHIAANTERTVPNPVSNEALDNFFADFCDDIV